MPQIAKGGKHVFGWSVIRADGGIRIPPEAAVEYRLAAGGRVILISGSRTTGGIVVSTEELLRRSALKVVLADNPSLAAYRLAEGDAVGYKGRLYGWAALRRGGVIALSPAALETYRLKRGDRLLVIRGSSAGFVMGVRGPLIEKARRHRGIPVY